jgi:hypothetical protein
MELLTPLSSVFTPRCSLGLVGRVLLIFFVFFAFFVYFNFCLVMLWRLL